MAKQSYYQVLGVSQTATSEQIKQAYRKLARQYHPDVSDSADAEARFKEINAAYDTLSDSLKRADYDQTLTDSGVRRGSPAGSAPAGQASAAPSYTDPNRQALMRAAFARMLVAGLVATAGGMLLQAVAMAVLGRPINIATVVLGALPALAVGLLYGADMNFKVETFLGASWGGRSYAFARTVVMSLGLAYYGGLLGSVIDDLVGAGRIFTAPLILLGVLIGAVAGSDGDTPEKVRSGSGRFNLLYTLVRGAEVGLVGAGIGAGLGAILWISGEPGLFGWSVFVGFALGMIVGSVKPPNLAAYASYASASVKNIIVIMMVVLALLVGIAFGALLSPQLGPVLGLTQ